MLLSYRQRACSVRTWNSCLCREDIFKEIDILVRLAHENVVYLKEYFQEINKARASGSRHNDRTCTCQLSKML